MKQWEDKVLSYGFAYPPKEGTALHGKRWLSVITTGSRESISLEAITITASLDS